VTQIITDVLVTFIVDHVKVRYLVLAAPVLHSVGSIVFVCGPLTSYVYEVFVVGQVICAIAGGIFESTLSLIVNSIPSEQPKGAMALTHSMFSWGVVGITAITTLLLRALGGESWRWIMLGWLAIPVAVFVLFLCAPFAEPPPEAEREGPRGLKHPCVLVIILLGMVCSGGAEQGLLVWSSAMAERGLKVDKWLGDLLGPALFVGLEGTGRTLFAVCAGKVDVTKVLLGGFMLAVACYVLATVQNNAGVALAAVGLTGLAVSELWPGFTSVAAECFPRAGNWMFGCIAIAGDAGCASGIGIIGRVADAEWARHFVDPTQPEESALRAAVLVNGIFALVGIFPAVFMMWWTRCHSKEAGDLPCAPLLAQDGGVYASDQLRTPISQNRNTA
jgi:MFS family permease